MYPKGTGETYIPSWDNPHLVVNGVDLPDEVIGSDLKDAIADAIELMKAMGVKKYSKMIPLTEESKMTTRKSKVTLRPLADRVVVRRDDAEMQSPGGIILPDQSQEKPQRGTVVAVGPGKSDGDGMLFFNYPRGDAQAAAQAHENAAKIQGRHALACPCDPKGDWPAVELLARRSKMSVRVGDTVLFPKYAGNEVTINDETLLIMREDDILAVLEDKYDYSLL